MTTEELLEAENFFIQSEQNIFYEEEFESLKNVKTVQKSSSSLSFNNENNLIRLGGVLEFSYLTTEVKSPFILPKHCWLTTLIVR